MLQKQLKFVTGKDHVPCALWREGVGQPKSRKSKTKYSDADRREGGQHRNAEKDTRGEGGFEKWPQTEHAICDPSHIRCSNFFFHEFSKRFEYLPIISSSNLSKSVLFLDFKIFVGWILISIYLHIGHMTFFRCSCLVNLHKALHNNTYRVSSWQTKK